jgi:hypothetical protein
MAKEFEDSECDPRGVGQAMYGCHASQRRATLFPAPASRLLAPFDPCGSGGMHNPTTSRGRRGKEGMNVEGEVAA